MSVFVFEVRRRSQHHPERIGVVVNVADHVVADGGVVNKGRHVKAP